MRTLISVCIQLGSFPLETTWSKKSFQCEDTSILDFPSLYHYDHGPQDNSRVKHVRGDRQKPDRGSNPSPLHPNLKKVLGLEALSKCVHYTANKTRMKQVNETKTWNRMCCRLALLGPMNLDTSRESRPSLKWALIEGYLGSVPFFPPCCLKSPDICIKTNNLCSANGVTHIRDLHIFSKIIVTTQFEHERFNMFPNLLLWHSSHNFSHPAIRTSM